MTAKTSVRKLGTVSFEAPEAFNTGKLLLCFNFKMTFFPVFQSEAVSDVQDALTKNDQGSLDFKMVLSYRSINLDLKNAACIVLYKIH